MIGESEICMGKFLIVSKQKHLMENSRLAAEYHMGYEYNDFYLPDVLENAALQRQIMDTYKRTEIPEYCTMHGAFLDVMVFSMDPRIREISELRMKQSMEIAKEIGARAVVFHTNVNELHTDSNLIYNNFHFDSDIN